VSLIGDVYSNILRLPRIKYVQTCLVATEILDLMRADIPLLNEVRAAGVRAPRG